jgi:hypothetical protein
MESVIIQFYTSVVQEFTSRSAAHCLHGISKMEIQCRKRRSQNAQHPLPNGEATIRVLHANIIDNRNGETQDDNGRGQPSNQRLVGSLDDVHAPAKLQLASVGVTEDTRAQLLRHPVVEDGPGRVGLVVVVEIMEEGLLRDGRHILQGALVVVIPAFLDFEGWRYRPRRLVDTRLGAALLHTETHPVNISWSIKVGMYASAAKPFVSFANFSDECHVALDKLLAAAAHQLNLSKRDLHIAAIDAQFEVDWLACRCRSVGRG